MKKILKELVEILFEKIKFYAEDNSSIEELFKSCSLNLTLEYFQELLVNYKKEKTFLSAIVQNKLNHDINKKRNQMYDFEANNFQELFLSSDLPEISQEQIDVLNEVVDAF